MGNLNETGLIRVEPADPAPLCFSCRYFRSLSEKQKKASCSRKIEILAISVFAVIAFSSFALLVAAATFVTLSSWQVIPVAFIGCVSLAETVSRIFEKRSLYREKQDELNRWKPEEDHVCPRPFHLIREEKHAVKEKATHPNECTHSYFNVVKKDDREKEEKTEDANSANGVSDISDSFSDSPGISPELRGKSGEMVDHEEMKSKPVSMAYLENEITNESSNGSGEETGIVQSIRKRFI